MTQQELDEVLAIVNQIRAALGAKPLKRLRKGIRGYAGDCPIANSVPYVVGVGGGYLLFDDEVKARKVVQACNMRFYYGWPLAICLPKPLSRFISEFDTGHLPQFERKPR